MTSDYFDGVPDCTRLAREIGQEIAATRPPNVLAHKGRVFWKLTDAASGALAGLAFTRPDARSELARGKVWTLIPNLQVFIANWFVSVDRGLPDQRWIHTPIDVYEALDLALLVPQPTAEGPQADHPARGAAHPCRHRPVFSGDGAGQRNFSGVEGEGARAVMPVA